MKMLYNGVEIWGKDGNVMGDTPWKWPYFDLKENIKSTFLEIKMTFSEIKLNKNLKSQSLKVPKKFILRIELVKIVKMEIEKRIQ